MFYLTQQSSAAILAMKSQVVRALHQDQPRHDALETLDTKTVSYIVTQDWAMKYLPCHFQETQSNWFGKEGTPCVCMMLM